MLTADATLAFGNTASKTFFETESMALFDAGSVTFFNAEFFAFLNTGSMAFFEASDHAAVVPDLFQLFLCQHLVSGKSS